MSMADLYKQFSDVHPNIVLKTDVLRQGLRISDRAQAAFNQRDDILWRGFHLFSYDSNTPKVYKNKIPMGFHLSDGCPIQIRTNDSSPYPLDVMEGQFVIPPFPSTFSRSAYLLCCLQDFECYHGAGILSKMKQDEMLAAGLKSTDKA